MKKCLNRATSKEGSVFYIGMGRGVNGNSRKFVLNVIFDSGTIPQVFVISEACHSSLWSHLRPLADMGTTVVLLNTNSIGDIWSADVSVQEWNDNIWSLCTAGGTDELRRDGREEMGEQLLASLMPVTAQHYLRAERASDIHLAAHPRAGHHHKSCWNLPAFI